MAGLGSMARGWHVALASSAAAAFSGDWRACPQPPNASQRLSRRRLCGPARADGPRAAELWREFGVRRASISGGTVTLLCTEIAGPPTAEDGARVKNMQGQETPSDQNPGLRVEPNFVSDEEAALLEAECRALLEKHGYSFAVEAVEVQRADADGVVEGTSQTSQSRRVTGRLEERDGQLGGGAPWGYGADFNLQEVPPTLRLLIERVQSSRFKVGPVRDLTINHRTNSFFKVDPHVDPLTDGPHVTILGLLSGAVLTFSPCEAQPRSGVLVEQRSWSDSDIDVLVRKRSLVLFTGDARYKWLHGVRAGFELDHPALGGTRVCDFWGNMANILPRQQERISVVMSFGALGLAMNLRCLSSSSFARSSFWYAYRHCNP